MMQRKFFIQEKKSSDPAKAKNGIGKAKASTWQCVNHQRQREQRFKSGGEQGTGSFSACVHTAGCDPWTKIPKDKLKEKASLLFLSQSVLLLSILGNCSSVSFLSTCWQPAPINTYSCFLVFLSLLFFILNPSFSQIRVSGSKKITCHQSRDVLKNKYIFHNSKLYNILQTLWIKDCFSTFDLHII